MFQDPSYKGYGMPKWSPQINKLSYADDTIFFIRIERISKEDDKSAKGV